MPQKTYLTKPSKNGRFFLQYYNDDTPSLANFSKIITSGHLGNAALQTLERYNRVDLFSSSPLSKSAINRENQDGSVSCSVAYPCCNNYVTCQNCCRTTSASYTCGCNGPTQCITCP